MQLAYCQSSSVFHQKNNFWIKFFPLHFDVILRQLELDYKNSKTLPKVNKKQNFKGNHKLLAQKKIICASFR